MNLMGRCNIVAEKDFKEVQSLFKVVQSLTNQHPSLSDMSWKTSQHYLASRISIHSKTNLQGHLNPQVSSKNTAFAQKEKPRKRKVVCWQQKKSFPKGPLNSVVQYFSTLCNRDSCNSLNSIQPLNTKYCPVLTECALKPLISEHNYPCLTNKRDTSIS